MAEVEISIDIEDELKKTAEDALKEMGLDIATACNMFLAKVAKEQRIPFNITTYNENAGSDSNMEG